MYTGRSTANQVLRSSSATPEPLHGVDDLNRRADDEFGGPVQPTAQNDGLAVGVACHAAAPAGAGSATDARR